MRPHHPPRRPRARPRAQLHPANPYGPLAMAGVREESDDGAPAGRAVLAEDDRVFGVRPARCRRRGCSRSGSARPAHRGVRPGSARPAASPLPSRPSWPPDRAPAWVSPRTSRTPTAEWTSSRATGHRATLSERTSRVGRGRLHRLDATDDGARASPTSAGDPPPTVTRAGPMRVRRRGEFMPSRGHPGRRGRSRGGSRSVRPHRSRRSVPTARGRRGQSGPHRRGCTPPC